MLSASYSQIIETANIIDDLKIQRNQISAYLSNAIISSNILCKVLSKLDDNQTALLMRYITPIIDDESETTWEELTIASTANLLRTCLSKKGP